MAVLVLASHIFSDINVYVKYNLDLVSAVNIL